MRNYSEVQGMWDSICAVILYKWPRIWLHVTTSVLAYGYANKPLHKYPRSHVHSHRSVHAHLHIHVRDHVQTRTCIRPSTRTRTLSRIRAHAHTRTHVHAHTHLSDRVYCFQTWNYISHKVLRERSIDKIKCNSLWIEYVVVIANVLL